MSLALAGVKVTETGRGAGRGALAWDQVKAKKAWEAGKYVFVYSGAHITTRGKNAGQQGKPAIRYMSLASLVRKWISDDPLYPEVVAVWDPKYRIMGSLRDILSAVGDRELHPSETISGAAREERFYFLDIKLLGTEAGDGTTYEPNREGVAFLRTILEMDGNIMEQIAKEEKEKGTEKKVPGEKIVSKWFWGLAEIAEHRRADDDIWKGRKIEDEKGEFRTAKAKWPDKVMGAGAKIYRAIIGVKGLSIKNIKRRGPLDISIKEIPRLFADGRPSFTAAMNELVTAGKITKEQAAEYVTEFRETARERIGANVESGGFGRSRARGGGAGPSFSTTELVRGGLHPLG